MRALPMLMTLLTGLAGTGAFASPGQAPGPAPRGCLEPPPAPAGLTSPARTPTSVTLRWAPVQTRSNCVVTYDIYLDGSWVLTVPTVTAVIGGLRPGTGHLFYVTAVNPAGASAPGLGLAVKTPAGAAPGEFNN